MGFSWQLPWSGDRSRRRRGVPARAHHGPGGGAPRPHTPDRAADGQGRATARAQAAGRSQVWGGRLVASALLMFSALGGPARPAGAVPVTVPTAPSRAVAVDPDRAPAVSARQYVVQPPEGRRRDTLWGIAERHLGNPR